MPTFIFANKYAASGAHEPEKLIKVIDTMRREAVEAEAAQRLGRVGDDAVAALALGAIERLVGAVQQRLGVVLIAFRTGDADADRDVQLARVAADDEGIGSRPILRRRSATA